jgi:hypothetical protein
MQRQKNNTTSKNVQCYKKAVKYNTNEAKTTGSHGGATSRRRRIVCKNAIKTCKDKKTTQHQKMCNVTKRL